MDELSRTVSRPRFRDQDIGNADPHSPSPLTFGQLSLLRSLQGEVNLLRANVAMVIDLNRPCVLEDVWAGLIALQWRHESLRTTFNVELGENPSQILHRDVPLPVVTVELGADTPDGRTVIATKLAESEFDIERVPGWRAAVLLHSGQAVAVALALHHIVADGWAKNLLHEEIPKLVENPNSKLVAPGSPTRLAKFQRSPDWASHQDRFERYWAQYFDRPDRMPSAGLTVPGRRRAGTRHLRWKPTEVDQLAQDLGLIPATLWICLGMTAWGTVHKSNVLVATLASANRTGPDLRYLVSNQYQVVPMSLTYGAEQPFADFAAQVQQLMSRAVLASCFDTDLVCRRLGIWNLADGLDHCINFYRDSRGRKDGAEMLTTWEDIDHVSWPRFYWRIRLAEKATIKLGFDPRQLGQKPAERLLAGWDQAFDVLASDPSKSVHRVLAAFAGESALAKVP